MAKETNWHSLSWQEVVKKLNSNEREGLLEKEAEVRQRKFGKNLLPEEKPLPAIRILLNQFRSPLIYILVIAGVITLILKDYPDAIVIFGAVFLNTVIGFFQENKTSNILSELKKAVKVKAYLIRGGHEKEVEQAELVPGDIILLAPGNKVPADARLIEARDLKVNESALTGEWIPAEKKIEILTEKTPLADRDNIVYMGSLVEDGKGKAVVTQTGLKTEIGKVAKILKESKEGPTPYQKKTAHLSKIIGIWLVFISFLIFLLGIVFGRDLFDMFLTAVAVAVAAIPEGLPVAITVILALGMQRILRKKGLVRKMVAAETLGSTSIIATDKTGTLTEAKMEVAKIYPQENNFLALKIGTLCSEAFIENPDDLLEKWVVRGRPTDKALLMAGIQTGLDKIELEGKEPEIDRLSFDPIHKYSATLRKISPKESILYLLGAPEKVLAISNSLHSDGKEKSLSKDKAEGIKKEIEELASKGERVLATAYKKIPVLPANRKNLEEEINNLVFVGLVSLHDPLRKEAKEAVKTCRLAGMKLILITGDHKLTAQAIARELGLKAEEKNIIEGSELEELTDEEFKKRLKDIDIYARVDPVQKLKIVQAWQDKGEVVAMTGDGINDAPALKKADIGLALGSGTDITKEASDLILLTDNFSIIVAAVEEGRAIVDNIRKTVTLLVSQSFSEIVLIGTSIIAGLPLPILPGQILWENLIEGSPQGIALAFEPKEKGITQRKPENPKSPLLTREIKTIIFGFGIFTDFLLFGLFLLLLKIGLPLAEIRTIIFAGLALDTFFYAFSCKNLRKNIWQYNPFSNFYLIGGTIFSFLMLLVAVYLPPVQNLIKTVSLDFFDWLILLGLGIVNIILIEAVKYYFINHEKNV